MKMDSVRIFMLSVILSIVGLHSSKADYSGDVVFTVTPQSQEELDIVSQHLADGQQQASLDVWKLAREVGKSARFLVAKTHGDTVKAWLTANNIEFIVNNHIQSDVQQAARKEAVARARSRTTGFNLDVYNNHSDINSFLERLARGCDICRAMNIGESYEGRNMVVFKIGRFVRNVTRGVWIDSGIHAREWVSPATALNIIDKLVKGYREEDEEVMWLLTHYIFYILPVANPDGYTYTRTTQRLWRKTRRPTGNPNCVGADPNRNWNFHWDEAGTSPDPCSEIFPGRFAFSEPETRNMRTFLWRRRSSVIMYLSFHAYGRYILYPWGFEGPPPTNTEQLHGVGERAVNKIQELCGEHYTLGSITNVMYPAAGSSADWAMGIPGIKYPFAVELPDDGTYGFLLPPEFIQPTFAEFWPALVEMVQAMHQYENFAK